MNHIAEIDKLTAEYEAAFGQWDSAALNWRPNAQSWSVAQVIHHLIVTNESYYPVLETLKKGAYPLPWISKLGFWVNMTTKLVRNAVDPANRKKTKTFPIWQPSQSDLPADIVQQLVQHHARLKQEISAAAPLLVNKPLICSPASRMVIYTLQDAFDIMVMHEQRHLLQAKAIAALRQP